MKVYLDNAATTKMDENVVSAMLPYFQEKYGNASSLHQLGQEASMALEESRNVIAKSINAKADNIIFTSGGTESNNLALKGLAFAQGKKTGKNHIITTKIEHDCVLNASKFLQQQGFSVTYLDVDKDGFILAEELKKAINEKTFLVSIIHANNEIGVVQDLGEIAKICKEKNVLFHTDACQSYTKVPINVKKQQLDLVTLNAHKIHGPKGIGVLYVREGISLTPLLHGGGHEFGLRSGTENIPSIIGFATAVKNAKNSYIRKMTKLRDKLVEGILKIPKTRVNGFYKRGDNKKRLCNNVNVSFFGIEGEAMGGYLDAKGICTSTGSACSSRTLEPSHVLKAIGLSDVEVHSSLRFSLSKYTTKEEIDYVLQVLPKLVEKLRKISPIK